MRQVSVPKEFFVKERRMYSNWRFAFWREFFQNSTDAHASRIRIFLSQDAHNNITVIFEDNGSGMSREVLENVYFSLGASTKTGGETVGGFGRARILTCFSMKSYEIHTQTNLVKGDGGAYDIEDAPQFDGCKITVEMENESFNDLKAALDEYLSQSQLACRVIINDQAWTAWSYRRQLTRTLDLSGIPFAKVYVNKTAANNRLLVRVNGTVMYSQYIRAKAQVIVEIEPSVAREVLNANRDGMHYKYATVLAAFIDELATDTNSALRSRLKNKSATIRGRGLMLALRKRDEQKVAAALKAAVDLPQAPVEQMVAAPGHKISLGQGSLDDVRNARRGAELQSVPIAEITGDLDELQLVPRTVVPVKKEPEVGERYLTDLPDVFIVDDTENEAIRKVMDSYNPENWVVGQTQGKKYNKGGNLYKLLMLWKVACQHAIDAYMNIYKEQKQISWGLGWFFADDSEAKCEPVAGGHALLLNPVDGDGRLKFSLRSKKDQKRLMAIAKHEVAHLAFSYHDESFAKLMTEIDGFYDEKTVFRQMSLQLGEGG